MTLILLNPHAQGGRAARAIPPFKNWLQKHAPNSSFAAPDKLQESLALLHNLPEGSRVVAVGGDGTLNRWLPAVLSRKLTLALVPMGSGNDCARALGLYGLSWPAALQHALNGPRCLHPALTLPALVQACLQCRPFKTLAMDGVDGVPLAADGECLGLATQLRVHCQRARLQAVTRQTSSNRPPTMNA